MYVLVFSNLHVTHVRKFFFFCSITEFFGSQNSLATGDRSCPCCLSVCTCLLLDWHVLIFLNVLDFRDSLKT